MTHTGATESMLSVHRADDGSYFIAYAYRKVDDATAEACRVSPFYPSSDAAVTAYHAKRVEYGELDA